MFLLATSCYKERKEEEKIRKIGAWNIVIVDDGEEMTAFEIAIYVGMEHRRQGQRLVR